MMVYLAFNTSTQETEARGSLWVHGPPSLHWEFQVIHIELATQWEAVLKMKKETNNCLGRVRALLRHFIFEITESVELFLESALYAFLHLCNNQLSSNGLAFVGSHFL